MPHALMALLLAGCGRGASEEVPSAATTSAAPAAEETAPVSMEARLGLDDRPFPLLTWSAYMIDVDYYDGGRFDVRRQLASALRGLEGQAPEILGAISEDHIDVTVGTRRLKVPIGTPSTMLETSDVLEKVLVFAQEQLALPDDALHELEYAAIDGMVAPLDPHTILLPPKATADLGVKTRGHFGGIGAEIRAYERRILISRVLPESPAERAGAEDGDLIVKIDDQSTVNMATFDAQQLLRGPVGVDVKVRVIRAGRYLDLTITRGKIRLPTTRQALLPDDVAYVSLLSFQEDTTERMVEALESLQKTASAREGLKGLVLDLRGNVGGLLSQATAVVDQFVDAGELVIVHSATGDEAERATRKVTFPASLPIVVLINEQSASAAEIVSGSLKHLDRAVVVGRTSFGKGTVQMLRDAVPYGESLALKMTIAEYRVAGDRKINSVGVRPQVTLLPVQTSELPGVVRYFDRERFSRWRQRYQTAFLPSAVHDEGADAFAVPEGPLVRYLDDAGEVADDATMSEAARDFMVDAEVRLAREIAVALAPHGGGSARAAALATLVPVLQERAQARVEQALLRQGIDWSRAPKSATIPALKVRAWIEPGGRLTSGEPFRLHFEVHNPSTQDAFRVRMMTDCPLDELDGVELLVGKVAAGARVEREIELQVMPWDASLVERMTVALWSDEVAVPGGHAKVALDVEGRDRPRFAFDWWVVDDPALARRSPRRPRPRFPVDVPFEVKGNGDGLLQPGERVLIAFEASNEGPGRSIDTRAMLHNLSGAQGLLEEGNVQLGKLRSGGTTTGAFGLNVSDTATAGVPVELELLVGDAHLRESTGSTFRIPVRAPEASGVEVVKGRVEVTADTARLYAGAHADTLQVAEVPRGTILDQVATTGAWVAVRGPDRRRLWLPRDLVAPVKKGRAPALSLARMVSPPSVEVQPTPARVDAASVEVQGVARHELGVADVTVSVEPTDPTRPARKLSYVAATSPELDAQGPSRAVPARDASTPPRLVRPALPFSASVPLADGGNKIIVQARDGYGVLGSREFYVYRTPPGDAPTPEPQPGSDAAAQP